MKKLLSLITALVLSISLYAQNDADINRLLLHNNDGSTLGYIIDRVDSLTFASVEGEVAADMELLSYDVDKVNLRITRTASCMGFKIAIVPSIQIASMSEAYLPIFIDNKSTEVYYQDIEEAEMSNIELEAGSDYTILTVGIDMYNVLCDVRKVEFTTEGENVVGDPYVEIEIIENNHYDFTAKFTPNEYVSKYSVLSAEAGTLVSQYQMFASMFGWANMGQMIESWGAPLEGTDQFKWTNMAPNTEYDILVQAWDNEGTMVPTYQTYTFTSKSLGGDGVAEVTITLGEYKLADWGGEMLPSQFITFTPNDQTSAYRIGVYLAEIYDPEAEVIKQELCSDPDSEIPVAGWYQYQEITTDYQINPGVEAVAIAAAKNVEGEWGPVTEYRFTTPAKMPTASTSNVIKERKLNNIEDVKGTVPSIKQKGQLRLISK